MNKYSMIDLTVSDCSDDDFFAKRSLTKDIEEERTLKNNFKRPKIKEEEIQHMNEALTQQEDDEDNEEKNEHQNESLYHASEIEIWASEIKTWNSEIEIFRIFANTLM